jgi:hypothetical protein
LATTHFPFHDHLPHLAFINYCWSEAGTFSLLRLKHLWRVSLYPDEGQSMEEAVGIDAVRDKLKRIAPGTQDHPVLEVRPYRIHQRVVQQYVVGRVVLPDDRFEASALPGVMINCAVCIRKSALDEVGGFPVEFFRQAEEYDLSFKLWKAGYSVERFEDLVYRHEKAPGNRAGAIVHRLDMRNNLILIERFFPPKMRRFYREDWTNRYLALARHGR